MKLYCKTVCMGTLLASLSIVQAVEQPFDFSANVALTSDYVWRGFTQTDEEMAIQGGFDIEHESGLYLGTWGSNVKFLEDETVAPEDRASMEWDLYLGFSNELPSGATYDIGYVYYAYPDAGEALNYDFDEFSFSLGYGIDNSEVAFSYAYAREFFGDVGKAHHYELSVNHALGSGFGLGGHVGWQEFSDEEIAGESYTHYGVSLSYSISGIDLSLAYSNTDLDDVDDVADDRIFVTISKQF